MATKAEEPAAMTTAPSEPHTSTPTLAEAGSTSQPHDVDTEKQPPAGPPAIPGAPFPDGGLRGWAAVAGAWLAVFATFGYANTFGAYQGYYQFQGYPNEPASNISWIGSVQLFFQFSLGAVSGMLYDKGYFRHLVIAGSIVYIVCLFMTSLAKEFWQTMLAQGIGIGIGTGLIFLPALSVISQYFLKRRSLAIGIVTTGSSVGGICLPIMLNNLIERHGFAKAVQYSGYLLLGVLVLSCLLMHPRFVPASLRTGTMKAPSPPELFKSKPYSLLVAGLFFVAWGLFFPIFYIQVYAQDSGISPNITFYLLAILNAASVFGRISPNFFADYIGNLNLMLFMCTGAGILSFSVFGAGSPGGSIVVSIFFGFFSGGYVSLIGPALMSMATHPSEIGIRIGMGFLATSFAALTGTPITGALLDKYGFYAPITWSGVTILAGSACFVGAIYFQRKDKGTWKV